MGLLTHTCPRKTLVKMGSLYSYHEQAVALHCCFRFGEVLSADPPLAGIEAHCTSTTRAATISHTEFCEEARRLRKHHPRFRPNLFCSPLHDGRYHSCRINQILRNFTTACVCATWLETTSDEAARPAGRPVGRLAET